MGYTYLSLSSASFCPAGSEFMLRFPIIGQAYSCLLYTSICYDRWHFGKYPELTMPEHLYYLNRVINCLLTHDKIIIRTDSLEEIIDVLGFEDVYKRQELFD